MDASPELFLNADDLVSTQESICDSKSAVSIAMNSDLSIDADMFPSDSEDCASSAVFLLRTQLGGMPVARLFIPEYRLSGNPMESHMLDPGVSEESVKKVVTGKTLGGFFVSKCCRKDCLLLLTAQDVLTLQWKFSSLGANAQRQGLGVRRPDNSRPSRRQRY